MIESLTSSAEVDQTSPRPSAPEVARQQGVNPVDYLRQRGFVYDITDEAGLRAAFDNGPVTAYIGFDPTGTSLHAGHMVSIMLLATLQRMGHSPIALGGGGTAMVGDPTGRTSSREIIGLEDLERNLASIQQQLAKYLDYDGGKFGDNPAAVSVNNADWLLPLHYIPFLRDIGRHFSVNEMLATDTYRTRLETTGLNFVEFNYRLVQAYDFLHLYREKGCLLQMGGSDQWTNITAGVELIRKADRGKAFALVSPLITTPSGEKMGKTGSGVRVWLDPEQFSPYDYYQYWVNTEDAMVETYLRQFTFLMEDEIADLTSVSGEALREAKQVLAFEATVLAHGERQAVKALEASSRLFSIVGSRFRSVSIPEHVQQLTPEELDAELAEIVPENTDGFEVSSGMTPAQDWARQLLPNVDMSQSIAAISQLAHFDATQALQPLAESLRQIAAMQTEWAKTADPIRESIRAMADIHAMNLTAFQSALLRSAGLNSLQSYPQLATRTVTALESLAAAGMSPDILGQGVKADPTPTVEFSVAELSDQFTVADAFIAAGLAKSRGEARRLAQQGGLSVEDVKLTDVDVPFSTILGDRNAALLRAGKKRFMRVVVTN